MSVRLLAVLLAAGTLFAAETPRPGSSFVLEFPELGEADHGGVMRCEVAIPSGYDPAVPVPLLAWFGGGNGGHSAQPAKRLAGELPFVCVGLSYSKQPPEGTKRPENPGIWSTPWSFYRTMLEAVERRVRNIDPQRRICAGFSSGGAAIAKSIGNPDTGFTDYFTGFMPGGAGWDMGGLDRLKGRPMLVFIGETDERFGNVKGLYLQAASLGVDAEFLVFEDHDHVMPDSYLPRMRQWMLDEVLRRGFPEIAQRMGALRKGGRWRDAVADARTLLRWAEKGSPVATAAEELLQEAARVVAQEAPAMAAAGDAAAMRAWLQQWEGWREAEPVRTACNGLGQTELAAIDAGGTSGKRRLQAFLDDWRGYAVRADALRAWDALAAADFAAIDLAAKPARRIKALERFVVQWREGATVERAKQARIAALAELAGEELAAIIAEQHPGNRCGRLRRFLGIYGETPQAAAARTAFAEAAAELLAGVKAMPAGPQRRKALREVAELADGTEAGREAAALALQ